MQYSFLENTAKRAIVTCNYNSHTAARHPDRIKEEHVLVYIKEGNWSIAQRGEHFELSAGDVILLHAGEHHMGVRPCEGTVNTCFIHFEARAADRLTEAWEDGGLCIPALSHCKARASIRSLFEQIIFHHWSEERFAAERAGCYLQLLLYELCAARQMRDDLSFQIRYLIRRNMHRFLSVAEIAAYCGYSVRTVSAEFKRREGMGIHAYQLLIKCRMAEELLLHQPRISLKEIAHTYGFYDEYHFSKTFKRLMGRSPKK